MSHPREKRPLDTQIVRMEELWREGRSLQSIGKQLGATAKEVNNFICHERSRGNQHFPERWKKRTHTRSQIVAILDALAESYPQDGRIATVRQYFAEGQARPNPTPPNTST